jgi:hypothetical protein
MNSIIPLILPEALGVEEQIEIVNQPLETTRRRKQTICERCGGHHRTTTHDKCVAEGRPLPRAPRQHAVAPIQRGRPIAAAIQPQVTDIHAAAILDENDDDGDNNLDGQLPNLLVDDIDSDDDDEDDNNAPVAAPGTWQEIIDEQRPVFPNQRELHHPEAGLFAGDNQEIPRFLGGDEQGPNYINIKRKLKENFVANGGDEREFRYNPETVSTLDIFQLFFSVAVMNAFVVATNAFGSIYYRRNWKNLTIGEFKAFLAIIICLGYIQFPRREVAFEKTGGFGCKFIYDLMSEDRFSHILRAWHYENYNAYTDVDIVEFKRRDAFWAVTSFAELLSKSFEAMWNLTQGCDIDEGGIPWRGRHKYRCYNNAKPFPFHFKIFSLNDAMTGFQKAFYLYRGKSEQRLGNYPATAWPIFKLFTSKVEHHGKGHILATDNWYTSIHVASMVAATGNYFVGTIKTNKSGLPAEGKFPKTGRGKKQRGVMSQMSSIYQGITLYFTAWMDKKPVHLLSTIYSNISTCMRRVKDDVTDAWTRVQFNLPAIIKIYNKFMGGTDGFDWRISCFRPKIITRSWVTKVFCHLLNASMVNAYLIYKWHHGKLGSIDAARFPLSEFVEMIMHELSNEYLSSLVLSTPNRFEGNWRTKSSWNREPFRRAIGMHWPRQNMVPINGDEANDISKYFRSRCIMCRRKVSTTCEQCEVFLCLDAPKDFENCWKQFHTKIDIIRCPHHSDF